MEIEFDPAKDSINLAKHGISLSRASDLQIQSASMDARRPYQEARYRAYQLIDDLPHCLAFTYRFGVIRAIGLRRVHLKEYRRHVG